MRGERGGERWKSEKIAEAELLGHEVEIDGDEVYLRVRVREGRVVDREDVGRLGVHVRERDEIVSWR